jgi:hypothetical protein
MVRRNLARTRGSPPDSCPTEPSGAPSPPSTAPATDALSGREPVARVGFFPNETRVKYFFETV